MEEISGQLNEELAVAVPTDADGPASIENWYTKDHVAAALLYYANTTNNSHDKDVISGAQKFYACVVRNNEDYELGGNRKRIKYRKAVVDLSESLFLTMNRFTDYLYLTPTGETQQEILPNTGNDALNQLTHLALRRERKINDLGREFNERFDNMNERFGSLKRESNERFDNQDLKLDHINKQLTSISAKLRNSFQGEGGNFGTSSGHYPLVNDEEGFLSKLAWIP